MSVNRQNTGQDDDFAESLPEMGAEETFCFDCGPDVPCFNRCCAELTLPLTPYDVLRLIWQLDMKSEDFLRLFTRMRPEPETGFPLPFLRMLESPDAPCPFVTPAGCSVYEDRPGACRSYPLGRGSRLARNGVTERFFMVREEHCRGFEHGRCRTPAQWFESQGLERYNFFNDRCMRLMSMVHATGRPLEPRMASMSLLCLYQLDRFRRLIEKMRVFTRVDMPAEQRGLIMEDSLQGLEARLDFAFSWLELAIFGMAPDLHKKGC